MLKNRDFLKNMIRNGAMAVITTVEKESKSFEERIELAMAKEINKEAKVEFLIQRIKDDMNLGEELTIYPKLEDKTCKIEAYVLTSNGEPVIVKDTLEDLMKHCTELILSGSETAKEEFIDLVKRANK